MTDKDTEEKEVMDEGVSKETDEKQDTPAPEKPKKEKKGDETAKLKADLADLNDKYLRMLAEYDNFRRRTQKEKEGLWGDAVAETLSELLPIADNLERAAKTEGDSETVRHGLSLTLDSLFAMLKKQGVEPFGEAGETFDPNLHNAVMHSENPDLGENVIEEVFQRGYRRGDKIIRFAMVKVAN